MQHAVVLFVAAATICGCVVHEVEKRTALMVGTLEIVSKCVIVHRMTTSEAPGVHAMVIAASPHMRITLIDNDKTVVLVNERGNRFNYRSGDSVKFGGGGSQMNQLLPAEQHRIQTQCAGELAQGLEMFGVDDVVVVR